MTCMTYMFLPVYLYMHYDITSSIYNVCAHTHAGIKLCLLEPVTASIFFPKTSL